MQTTTTILNLTLDQTDPPHMTGTGDWSGRSIEASSTGLPVGVFPDAVVIDGYTQAGSLPAEGETPARLMIALDGSMASFIDGITLEAGNSTVRGLSIYGFGRD